MLWEDTRKKLLEDQKKTKPDEVKKQDPADKEGLNKPKKLTDKTKTTTTGGTTVVAGTADPKDKSQINVADYASNLISNPRLGFLQDDPKTKGTNESMFLTDRLKDSKISTKPGSEGLMDPNNPKFQMDADKLKVNTQNVDTVANRNSATYDAAKTYDQVAQQDMQAAQGQVSQNAQITDDKIAQHDLQGAATGVNADGSVNYVGQALQKYATQNMSNIVDTTTAEGKMLAEQLGEGNYTDSKATLQGQLAILQGQFMDANGNPTIPVWASGAARNVSKIAAFSGMTGTAATAAMATALMEASIPIAQQDAQFFQTLTLQNLSNRQQSTINTANVLAKFSEQNVDNRMAAAIQNAKSFLQMDLANLSNEQQSRVINNQNRVQSILEDAKAENTKRMFVAESQNEMDMFYDQMNTQIKQFNSSQNLDAQKFNATMEDSREKFYKEMQYNIAVSNAKWRQTVQLQEDQQAFEAATQDVRNMMDLSVNQLNQVWDRSDALLDYVWKSSENEKDRKNKLAQLQLQGDIQEDAADKEGFGKLVGSFFGSDTGKSVIDSVFGGLF